MSKRFIVTVHMPVKSSKASDVCSNLGQALRTADAYPARPSVILSGSANMLRHAKQSLTVPPQKWLTTKAFLSHVYAIAALFDFKVEVIQNIASWDVRKAKEGK